MSETLENGLTLLGVGLRLDEILMAKWILEPHAIRPSARLPNLVSSVDEAAHLATFLRARREEYAKPQAVGGDAKAGGFLFA